MTLRTNALSVVLVVLAGSLLWARGAPKPPSLVTACGSSASALAARPLWLRTSDGVHLYAVEAGTGPTTVVLAHQGRSDLCEELPYAKTLLANRLRVLAFDFRGNGQSQPSVHSLALRRDLAAAVARARQDGATRVFLIGASMGGAAAVQNGGGLRVTGIVSLSGTRLWPGFGINKPGPTAVRVPFLYLGSRSDWRAPLAEARGVVRAVSARDKRSVFYRGSLHGWQLVQDAPFAPQARALIVAWLRAHSTAR
jgi:pimeloyl-ACP methyl ester carboxylesterase